MEVITGLETDGKTGNICADCHNSECKDPFRHCGSVLGCPDFTDSTGRKFHMSRASL
jgi:hypothetical protein